MGSQLRHHYLPQSYLKGFIDPNNKPYVWIYEKGGDLIKPASVRHIAVHKNYYSFKKEDGTTNRHSFETGFEKIESITAPAIKKIINYEDLRGLDRSHVATFLSLSMLRVPSFRDNIKSIIESDYKAYSKHLASDENRFEDFTKSAKNEVGLSNIELDELRTYVLKGEYKIEVDKDRSLGFILSNIFEIAQAIHSLDWNFWVAPNRYKFVTCDNPLFYFNPQRKLFDQKGVGFQDRQVELSFPLSKDIAIFASWKLKNGKYININENKVKEINRRTIISANRFIYSSKKSNIIRRIVEKYENIKPIMNIEFLNNNGEFISILSRNIEKK